MPRILDFTDDNGGPFGLYAPLRDTPAPDGGDPATLSALDALPSVVARPQQGYDTIPSSVPPPEAPATRVLNQVVSTSGGQEVPYPQADASPFLGALDGQNDGAIGLEPAAGDTNAPDLYAQLRQQQRRGNRALGVPGSLRRSSQASRLPARELPPQWTRPATRCLRGSHFRPQCPPAALNIGMHCKVKLRATLRIVA